MAILQSNGNLSGTIGPVVYRNWRDILVVQSRPKPFKQTLASKESGKEFGLISTTAKIVRDALNPAYEYYDGKMVNRFNSSISDCIRNSKTRGRGNRDLHDGELSYLNGFEFNANSQLSEELQYQPECRLTKEGHLFVRIPAQQIKCTKVRQAASFTLRLLVTALNFKEEWGRYIKHVDIKPGWDRQLEQQEWLIEDIPTGCIVVVSLSLMAADKNNLREHRSLNTKNWSPAAIIGAYTIAATAAQTPAGDKMTSNSKSTKAGDIFYHGMYAGNMILKSMALLRKNHIPTLSEKLKKKLLTSQKLLLRQDDEYTLPSEKIDFKNLRH